MKDILTKVIKKLSFTEKDEKYHKELIEEIEQDKNFKELSSFVALKQHSHLKAVHQKLVEFIKTNFISGMTTYGEAWDKFYQSGYGKNAEYVHELMGKEGIKTAFGSEQYLIKVLYRKVGNKGYMPDLEKILKKLDLSDQEQHTLLLLAKDLDSLGETNENKKYW